MITGHRLSWGGGGLFLYALSFTGGGGGNSFGTISMLGGWGHN